MRPFRTRYVYIVLIMVALLYSLAPVVYAAESEGSYEHDFATTFFWIAIILLAAKLSSLIEHVGQPAVLGELMMGVLLGNLVLFGIDWFEPPKANVSLLFFADLGVVILLFQVGLESRLIEMRRVGISAGLVAVAGVITPFVLGTYVVGPLLLPGLEFNTYLFLGAALTATSVGITARVFRDLGQLHSAEAKTVLGAAVIDDILGLIILAVVSAIVTAGSVSLEEILWIIFKAITFLVVTVISGVILAPHVNRLFSKINAGIGMKFTLIATSGLIFAYLADLIGLAPIVGAFAAGLVLEPVHYKDFKDPEIIDDLRAAIKGVPGDIKRPITKVIEAHSKHHVEELVEPVAHFFVPIFFVMTGMAVKLDVLFDPSVLLVALGVTIVAVVGKILAGLVATGKVKKWIIGWSMVPRGEVGLIFATVGKSLHVVTDEVFSVIVIMVILTTLLTPPVLTYLLKRPAVPAREREAVPAVGFGFGEGYQMWWQAYEGYDRQTSTRQLKKLGVRGTQWRIPTKR